MIDFKKNIVTTGDTVVTFVIEVNGTRLRTGTIVKIYSGEHNVDWAEIQLETKIGDELFHTYIHRNGAQLLKHE